MTTDKTGGGAVVYVTWYDMTEFAGEIRKASMLSIIFSEWSLNVKAFILELLQKKDVPYPRMEIVLGT